MVGSVSKVEALNHAHASVGLRIETGAVGADFAIPGGEVGGRDAVLGRDVGASLALLDKVKLAADVDDVCLRWGWSLNAKKGGRNAVLVEHDKHQCGEVGHVPIRGLRW